jgi:hypothetical protein
MSEDRKILDQILLYTGETKATVANLDGQVKEIKSDLNHLRSSTVSKDELNAKISGMKDDWTQDLQAVQTEYATRQTNASSKKGAQYWVTLLGGVTLLLAFIGTVITGIARAGRYMERMDRIAEKAEESYNTQKPYKPAKRKPQSRLPANSAPEVPTHIAD